MTTEASVLSGSSTLGSMGTPIVQGSRVATVSNGQVIGYTETVTFSQPV